MDEGIRNSTLVINMIKYIFNEILVDIHNIYSTHSLTAWNGITVRMEYGRNKRMSSEKTERERQ